MKFELLLLLVLLLLVPTWPKNNLCFLSCAPHSSFLMMNNNNTTHSRSYSAVQLLPTKDLQQSTNGVQSAPVGAARARKSSSCDQVISLQPITFIVPQEALSFDAAFICSVAGWAAVQLL